MYDATTASFATSIGCLAALALVSAPHLSHAASQRLAAKRKYEALTEKYEDEDGTATTESQEEFSDRTQRVLLILESFATSVFAVASAVLTLTRNETASNNRLVIQQWLQAASWVWLIFCRPILIY